MLFNVLKLIIAWSNWLFEDPERFERKNFFFILDEVQFYKTTLYCFPIFELHIAYWIIDWRKTVILYLQNMKNSNDNNCSQLTKQLITQFHIYESFDHHDKFMANVLENFWLFTLINDTLYKKGKKLGTIFHFCTKQRAEYI